MFILRGRFNQIKEAKVFKVMAMGAPVKIMTHAHVQGQTYRIISNIFFFYSEKDSVRTNFQMVLHSCPQLHMHTHVFILQSVTAGNN